jgi:ElaB/YqjD/DUF883 family membrane-anchored ribosome-binding protein
MANLTTDVSNKTNGAASDFKNKILNAEHGFEKMAQNAGEQAGAMASDFARKTATSMKSSQEYVKENPIKGVAIAAAAGLFAGSLITMAMRSRKD